MRRSYQAKAEDLLDMKNPLGEVLDGKPALGPEEMAVNALETPGEGDLGGVPEGKSDVPHLHVGEGVGGLVPVVGAPTGGAYVEGEIGEGCDA